MKNRILHARLRPLSIVLFCISILTIQAQTWTAQTSGITTKLVDAAFVSATKGWAVGENGVVLTTSNAGTTWAPQASGLAGTITGVSFASATHGWIVENSVNIKATIDGGATWVSQTSASTNANTDVCFVSSTVGWIVSGQHIQKTTDGGATWVLQSTGSTVPLTKCFFISATHGWVIGALTGTSQRVILRTTDGGATWTPGSFFIFDDPTDIHFTSTTTGYACAGQNVVLKTTNGGANWSVVNTPYGPGLKSIFFLTATAGWVINGQGNIMATSDGGATWRFQPSGVTTAINKITVSGENGFVVGDNGKIIATNNASRVSLDVPSIIEPTYSQVMDNGCNNGISNGTNWKFSWSTIANATGYDLYVDNAAGVVLINQPTTLPNYEYITTTVTAQPYYCKVRAKFAGGLSGDWSPATYVTVEPINTDCQPSITSATTGLWSATSTWVGGIVPTINNDVIIDVGHTITIPTTGNSNCKNLTVNGTINNEVGGGRLKCAENMTISATGAYNCSNVLSVSIGTTYPEGGVLSVGADVKSQGTYTSGSPANNKIISVNGGTFKGYVVLAGRITATNGATVNLKGSEFRGWNDPSNLTPQFIVEADNTSTVTATEGQYVFNTNGLKPHFTPNVVLSSASPSCVSNKPSFIIYNGSNNNCELGSLDRDQVVESISSFPPGFYSNIHLKRLTMNGLSLSSNFSSSLALTSTNSKFTTIYLPPVTTTLSGTFELINGCSSSVPYFAMSASTSIDNTFGLKINVLDTAVLDLSAFTAAQTLNVTGTLTLQSGKLVVKGGTLDLTNATITGLDENRYFIIKNNNANTKKGAVILPGVTTTPRTFNLGLSIPNGANPPTTIYAPLNIVSNVPTSGASTNVNISLETLTAPAGYIAPQIQWNITPLGASPDLTITFTWPASAESTLFAFNRQLAKIFHQNSMGVWEQLSPIDPMNPVQTNANGSFSITVANIRSFSPFAVLIPNAVLPIELINFSVINKGNKSELNWQTASEFNVKNFDIEKSFDSKNFLKIAEIKANSTPSVYSAFDDQFLSSAYYRLKINDLDGTSNYSKIVFLEKGNEKSIKISQNTEGSILIETNDKIELITITNTIGQLIKSTKDKQFLMNELNSGIYIISVKTDKGFFSKKIFKN